MSSSLPPLQEFLSLALFFAAPLSAHSSSNHQPHVTSLKQLCVYFSPPDFCTCKCFYLNIVSFSSLTDNLPIFYRSILNLSEFLVTGVPKNSLNWLSLPSYKTWSKLASAHGNRWAWRPKILTPVIALTRDHVTKETAYTHDILCVG